MSSYLNRLQHYPLAELQRAREDFCVRWHSAAQHDPVVRLVSVLHSNFPPHIRMVNCEEYPFYMEDHAYHMPSLSHVNSYEPPTKRTRSRYCRDRLGEQCSHLTEAILYEESDNVQVASSDVCPSFVCDNCSFSTDQKTVAQDHLKSENHTSVSLYRLGNAHADADEKSFLMLCEPRILYNRTVPSFNWLSEKTVVVCPSCHLIFPDKLMCAFHHQSHHEKHYTKYAFGTVLAVRDFVLSGDLMCSQCGQSFTTQRHFAEHWSAKESPCHSPFEPVFACPGQPPAHLIVEAYCHTCRSCFERYCIQPVQSAVSGTAVVPIGRKRKRPDMYSDERDPDEHDYATSRDVWTSGFGRFCLNHVYLHLLSSSDRHSTCRMHVRIIQIHRGGVQTLPPYRQHSDRDLVLYCIHECKRFLTYMANFHGSRRDLFRRGKRDLKRLLEQADTLRN